MSIDGNAVGPIFNRGTDGYSNYAPVTVDVSAHAGPGAHLLKFGLLCVNYGTAVRQCPRFDIDDVSLTTPDPPPPPLGSASTLTGQRAAALNRCKQKAKKKDWSKKRLKKCKRQANALPV